MWATIMNLLLAFGFILFLTSSCYLLYAFRVQRKRLEKIHELAQQNIKKENLEKAS
jgi:hypothetical protein